MGRIPIHDDMITCNFTLPRDLREAAKKRARELGLSLASYIRYLIVRDTGWKPGRGGVSDERN